MNKSIYFVVGLVLAGIGTAGFWALNTETRHPEPVKKEAKKVSLLTINYIPTIPTKPIDEGTFWELKASAETEPVVGKEDARKARDKAPLLSKITLKFLIPLAL